MHGGSLLLAPPTAAPFRSRRTSPWKKSVLQGREGGGQSLRSLLTCADRKAGGWQLSKPNSAQRGGEARRVSSVSWSLSTVWRPRLLNGGVSFSGRVSPLKARMKLCMLGVGAEGKVCSGRRDHGEINGSLRCDIHPLPSLCKQVMCRPPRTSQIFDRCEISRHSGILNRNRGRREDLTILPLFLSLSLSHSLSPFRTILAAPLCRLNIRIRLA